MPQFSDIRYSDFTTKQVFDVVADIKSYPEFLPWVSKARVKDLGDNKLEAELIISFKSLSYSYSSLVTLFPPEDDESECEVDVKLLKGPFKDLITYWHIQPCKDKNNGKTRIFFEIDFQFKSKVMEKLIGGLFMKAVEIMVDSFKKRAEELYK